jgi:hypothetical protein
LSSGQNADRPGPLGLGGICGTLITVMLLLRGVVQLGKGDFAKRIEGFREVFKTATGEYLQRGTLNVKVAAPVEIREHFRIDDPFDREQVLQFEVCRANGKWAYRIRPRNIRTGCGGWGDDVIEIGCSEDIPNAAEGNVVDMQFFR